MTLVSKFEDENRRLRGNLQENRTPQQTPTSTETISTKISFVSYDGKTIAPLLGITREELQCIKNLTEENIKIKQLLKAKNKELTQKTLDVEAVSLCGQVMGQGMVCLVSRRFKLNLNVSARSIVHYGRRIRSRRIRAND